MATKKHSDAKMGKTVTKKAVRAAVHKHERSKHPGKPLTKLAKGGTPKKTMKG
jgi:hypothetical protein